MSISRNVILDLLPVYLAGEASEDTRVLIEEHLETDEELALMVAESKKEPFPRNLEVPRNREAELASLEKVQKMIHRTIIFGSAMVLFVCVSLMLVVAGLSALVSQ
jgi:anti-sigma factor RsiW